MSQHIRFLNLTHKTWGEKEKTYPTVIVVNKHSIGNMWINGELHSYNLDKMNSTHFDVDDYVAEKAQKSPKIKISIKKWW